MNLAKVLDVLRADALSEHEKGARFERLIKSWFRSDPTFASVVKNVWLWSEFPSRGDFGSKDLGIDLVVRTELGEYWAVQCKFYADDTVIDKTAVDSFISNSSRVFRDPVSGNETSFAARYWISTSDNWNANALEIVKHQQVPFIRLTLEHFERSEVDWEALLNGTPEHREKKHPMKHQKEAMDKAHGHFSEHDRGQLIMACGTGKTYTALCIAMQELRHKGSILFLVPSISLLNQSLNAWMADTEVPIKAVCICSDAKASRKKSEGVDESIEGVNDLALPATTNSHEIARRYAAYHRWLEGEDEGLLVVFSTYQSIDAVADAQKAISTQLGVEHSFDLIVCDEAHRTTGVIDSKGQSDFTKIHDNGFIRGGKRLYMTATPRLYADNAKARARQSDYELCSMDDVSLYGEEFYRAGFAYAVSQGLLTDYKVLVLTVGSEHQLPPELQAKVQDPGVKELDFDLASRLIGCINGLAKNTKEGDGGLVWDADPRVMRRAIAFCPNIDKKGDPASSKNTSVQLPLVGRNLFSENQGGNIEHRISISAKHIDGSMDSGERGRLLRWLAEETGSPEECRVLCNVRCLSEGIDVPALDAAIFLSPRNSQVDVVQSVGRVMRNFRKGKSDEKKFGYIIIPIVVNPNVPAEEALNDNKSFAVLWSVLNALRSHDERFNAIINSIALNKEKPVDKISVSSTPIYNPDAPDSDNQGNEPSEEEQRKKVIRERMEKQLSLLKDLDERIYAKMVEKVGSRLYWERWVRDIGPVAANLIGRIKELVAVQGPVQSGFKEFVERLREAINDAVSEEDAVTMLGQHLITRPVFDALFQSYEFDSNNAVTRAMQQMIALLEGHGMRKDTAVLDKFYESVRMNLGTVKTLAGKQTVIKNLYDNFFRDAFPRTVEQLGIVYTPVECVDFILHSVNDVLKKEFGIGLTDKNVHILDPFAGTGTFITRLLQLGLIRREDMERKYLREIHCNEIVLLAYYVADVNIESVFHDIMERKDYLNFDGICLTDTFAMAERFDRPGARDQLNLPGISSGEMLEGNTEQIRMQRKAPIRVIVGNPPYSAGQKSANDNAKNMEYPALDKRIEETYVSAVKTTNKNSLYDSYIRAFRWASDRLRQTGEGGVIGFITNGGWLDGNAAAGFRKCLEDEFSSIWVLHLRGDARTSGELRRKEGDGVFGLGSRAPVVITILVYNPKHGGKASIHFYDIGDYLTRDQKLKSLFEWRSITSNKIQWQDITSNEHNDWINQRSDLFGSYIIIGDKKDKNSACDNKYFNSIYSRGLETGRDAWVYNYSINTLSNNIYNAIQFFNKQSSSISSISEIDYDKNKFSWDSKTEEYAISNKKINFNKSNIYTAIYRPFSKN